MRILITSILFVILAANLNAQNYRSVFENNYWEHYVDFGTIDKNVFILNSEYNPWDDPTERLVDHMFYEKDSIINDTIYKCLRIKYYTTPNKSNKISSKYYYELYRESDDFSKVFCRIIDKEYLIYDISLSEGQSFNTHIRYRDLDNSFYDIDYDTTLYVDSISYINARKIIYFNFYLNYGPYSHQLFFIEGIGPSTGFYVQKSFAEHYTILLSAYKNEHWNYLFPGIVNSIYNNIKIDQPKVYPNPCAEYLIIENADIFSINKMVSIFDIKNNLVFKSSIINGKIKVSNLNPGLYFIKYYSSNKQQTILKFLKL